VCDILSRISRLLPRRFFALVPIPELGLSDIGTGARPSCDTRPGLRSRPLGRRSGCSSAEPYPPPSPSFSLRPSCLSPNLLHRATGQQPDCLMPPATGDRAQQGSAHETGRSVRRRDVPERAAHTTKPKSAVPFPLISIGGTGTTVARDQSSRCHPAAVRPSRPARSSDSSTSPSRSFLTARQSRSFARVSTMPPAKLSSTRSSRPRGLVS
jgi:hypothetical protein